MSQPRLEYHDRSGYKRHDNTRAIRLSMLLMRACSGGQAVLAYWMPPLSQKCSRLTSQNSSATPALCSCMLACLLQHKVAAQVCIWATRPPRYPATCCRLRVPQHTTSLPLKLGCRLRYMHISNVLESLHRSSGHCYNHCTFDHETTQHWPLLWQEHAMPAALRTKQCCHSTACMRPAMLT